MKRKNKFTKESSKKKINFKISEFNDLSEQIDDEFNFFPLDYSFIIF